MARQNEAMSILLGFSSILGINFLFGTLNLFFISEHIASILLPGKTYGSSPENSEAYLYGLLLSVSSICIYQYLYVVPMIIWLKRQRKFGLMKGVIIGAVITTLLAGSCFGLSLESLLSR